jgi:hypothetical protein
MHLSHVLRQTPAMLLVRCKVVNRRCRHTLSNPTLPIPATVGREPFFVVLCPAVHRQ